jgi:glutathione S-transferase
MAFTLHYSPDSANLVVRMALEEFGLPYIDQLVDRSRSEQRGAAYRALNPQGLLPVLIDPDQDEPLFETGAILLHLEDYRNRLAGHNDRATRGRLLKWLFYLSNTVHADLRALFYTPRYTADPATVPALRQGLLARLDQHFALLDGELARRAEPFLLGTEPTVCDLYAAVCARWAQLYPEGATMEPDRITGHGRFAEMLERLQALPSVIRACAREHISGPAFITPRLPAVDRASISG